MQLVWLLINMLFWLLVGFVSVRLLSLLVFSTQGVTTLRVRIMQKLILVRRRLHRHRVRQWPSCCSSRADCRALVLRMLHFTCRSVSMRTWAAR